MSERLTGAVNDLSRLDGGVVELSLLLPQWQIDAIEAAASVRGITTGQMLRRVINTYLTGTKND